MVETLLKGDLVDPQILLAIRRSFYWKAKAASNGKRNSLITSEDLAARRGVQGIFVDSSLDTSIARRHAIAAASSMPDSRRRCGRRRTWLAPPVRRP